MKKIILTKKLYAELRKWEGKYGFLNANTLRLFKLYIGMDVDLLISEEGKILARDFNKVAFNLRSRSPQKLIRMAVESGSFYYGKCTKADMNNYGVLWLSSPVYASGELLTKVSETTHIFESKSESKSESIFEHNLGVIKNNTIYSHSEGRPNGIRKCAGRAGRRGGADTAEDDGARFVPAVLEHPHGMYEYCYPGLPQRYYDVDGLARPIPDGAPDRPDDTVTWSTFSNRWYRQKQINDIKNP